MVSGLLPTEDEMDQMDKEVYGPTQDEQRFHKLIQLLATRCKVELDKFEIEIYDRHLQPYGYKKACEALEGIIIKRRGRDPWPSVNDVISIINPKMSTKLEAMDFANRMLELAHRMGNPTCSSTYLVGGVTYTSKKQVILDTLGEFGVLAYERFGGYTRFCEEMWGSNPAIFRAQVRDSIEAIIQKEGQNDLLIKDEKAQAVIENKGDKPSAVS